MLLERPIYITQKGLADLQAELEYLREVKRPQTVEWLREARGGGDWTDNTEQMLIEEELAFIDGRIQELEHMLAHARLIGPDPDESVINIGDTVVIATGDEELETYTIVGSPEANPSEGFISNESPLGRALLGHRAGDEVLVKAPVGMLRYRVVAVN